MNHSLLDKSNDTRFINMNLDSEDYHVIKFKNHISRFSNMLFSNDFIALANPMAKEIVFYNTMQKNFKNHRLSINTPNSLNRYNTLASIGNLLFYTSGNEVFFIDTTLLFMEDNIPFYKLGEFTQVVNYIHYGINKNNQLIVLLIFNTKIHIYELSDVLKKCKNKNFSIQPIVFDYSLPASDVLRIPIIIQNKLFVSTLLGSFFVTDINSNEQKYINQNLFFSLSSPVMVGKNLYMEYITNTLPYKRGGIIFDTQVMEFKNNGFHFFEKEYLEYNLQNYLNHELFQLPSKTKEKDEKAFFLSQNIGSGKYFLTDSIGNVSIGTFDITNSTNALVIPSYYSIQRDMLHILIDNELHEIYLNPSIIASIHRVDLNYKLEDCESIGGVKYNMNRKAMLFTDRILYS
ncbi:MAG: hypothetical protein H7A23_22725 [Leptospiraceae bacterium]|nr:hypothetical protein [Leptospiraceae bacterium]MCP5497379.1 hypothetical protein [Leptospiraceae bacterium]